MHRIVLLVLLLSLTLPLTAQETHPYYGITCATRDTAVGAFLPASSAFLTGEAEVKTQFDLVFSDNVPAVAQAAMRFAANVWGTYLDSDVPVRVEIDWEDRDDERLLASAGPATLFRDFAGGLPNTWYPVALAEAIAGRDLNATDDADIVVNANSTANWYFGTDGETPRGSIDLVSVMLHELGHGLGFLSSVDTINENQLEIGFGERFIVYDLFLETPSGVPLTDPNLFTNPSEELLTAVISNDLLFTGPRATQENEGNEVRLFSPSTFDVGSSVSHLNEASYPPGTENALMTPFLASGEAVHDPGPVTLGIFSDLGWPLDFSVSTAFAPAAQTPLVVFPNPVRDQLTVRLPEDLLSGTVLLFDGNGRRVLARTVAPAATNLVLPTVDLPGGVYHLAIIDGPVTYGARVLVNR